MINVSLSSVEKIIEDSHKVDPKDVSILAWKFIRSGMSKSDAFDRAWDEFNGYFLKEFSTDAPIDQIEYIIKMCSKNGIALTDKLMLWDTVKEEKDKKIFSRIDWISYQLERMGFKIEKVDPKLKVYEKYVPLLPKTYNV